MYRINKNNTQHLTKKDILNMVDDNINRRFIMDKIKEEHYRYIQKREKKGIKINLGKEVKEVMNTMKRIGMRRTLEVLKKKNTTV